MNEITILTWSQYLLFAENHGAKIEYLSNGVNYSAPLLPPGTSIYTWQSFSNFQNTRANGSLPLLKSGLTYQIVTNLVAQPADSVYLKITTYNDAGLILQEILLAHTGGTFEYSAQASRYQIQLIATTNQQLHFNYLALGLASQLATTELQISPDLLTTGLLTDQATMVDIYVGRRNSGSWSIPVTSQHQQLFLRIEDQYYQEPEQQANQLIKRINQFMAAHPNLKDLPLNIKAIGYPLTELVSILKTQLKPQTLDNHTF
ncbi:accessory Sec system protein Asp3 [Lapidilactobacillus wuchangensis]|uniref:accessory Sec system protein Asp3 n=1 Tax=Lapidilactobacillus wuchangensis TaxID=2486001 RepID=UPI000F7900BE|nr:accessory Sec system protein Asp3 [Lapidilactobacillus wuchangensis]